MKYYKNNMVRINSKKNINLNWSIKIFFLTLALSISFSILSELVLNTASILISIFIIVLFLTINVFMDMIGVAVTAGSIVEFNKLVKDNIKGAKEGRLLLTNAEKVSVFCCDIIGDICGILSGACGASILIKIISESNSPIKIIISSIISGLIAGLTIFFKSIEKGYAVNSSTNIILKIGKLLSVFKLGNR